MLQRIGSGETDLTNLSNQGPDHTRDQSQEPGDGQQDSDMPPEGTVTPPLTAGGRRRYPDVVDEDGTVRQMTAREYRRLRRRVTNRESAKRMRAKREGELASVQHQVRSLQGFAWQPQCACRIEVHCGWQGGGL